MKILKILPYTPVPPTFGGAMRIYYLLKSLASKHDVTVVMFGTPDKLELFSQEFGDLVREIHMITNPWSRNWKRTAQCYSVLSPSSYSMLSHYSHKMQKKIDDLLSSQDFDAIHLEFPYMAQFKFSNNLLRIIDMHNVEYDNFRRMWEKSRKPLRKWFYYKEYKKMYREEVEAIQRQNLILTTSKEDMRIIKKDVQGVSAYVVPNGVDTTYFTPSLQKPEPWSLVFTGMMGYTPNHDGIFWFLDEIFPLILEQIPEAKIYIVGNRPPAELKSRQTDQIIVTGFVDDVRPYVWKSSVFVVPLRMGSGTRLKVVEALAMKKPVVSTSIGCEGIEVEHDQSILIEDEPERFARSVVSLLKQKNLRNRLTEQGYELVKSTYDWSVIGQGMLDVYNSIQEGKAEPKHSVLT